VAGPRVSLGYFSLHEQREVTRSSAGRVKARDLALALAMPNSPKASESS
jgi:hypothetical protein